MAIRLPNQDDIASVGVARDPGISASPDDFGAQVGRAQQHLGATIRNLGDIGMQLAKQRQEPEDRAFIDTFDNAADLEINQGLLDAETNAPAGGDGFRQGVDDTLTPRGQALRDRLIQEKGFRPSKKALRAAELLYEGKKTNALMKAQTFEHNARIGWLQSQREETAEGLIERAQASGDPTDALAKLDDNMAAYEGLIPADKLQADHERYQERIVQGSIDGLNAAGRIDEAKALSEKYFGSMPRAPEPTGEAAVDTVVNKIIGVESGGNPNARNPKSSAAGLGQFIDSTWLSMVRKHRPDIAAGKTAGQIIALKTNGALSKEMTRAYTVENGEFLANRGIAQTPGNLYLAHFLGPQGATLVLKADPAASIESIVGPDAVRANPFLKGKSASQVAAWADKKMGGAARGAVASEGPADDPIMPNADAALKNNRAYENALSAIRTQERMEIAQEREIEQQIRSETVKTGYDMIADDELTEEWVEANRDILSATDYKAFRKVLLPSAETRKTDPDEYLYYLDLAEKEPERALEEVRQAYANDSIAQSTFNTVTSRARENMSSVNGRSYASELRSYISSSLSAGRDATPSIKARSLDAQFQFDDWMEGNPKASRDETRKQAQTIIDDFRKIRYREGATSLPLPRFTAATPESMTFEEIGKVKDRLVEAFNSGKIDQRDAAEQAALLRRWTATIEFKD